MAFDASVLDRSIDGEDPCGPDLDAEGDPEFLAFMANVEGQMPASYFSFDPANLDHDAILDAAAPLLEQTRDVRLLMLVAKVMILSRDLAGFVAVIDTIRKLFETHWATVKPMADETGDYAFRLAPLLNLDDVGSLVFPLQFAPMVQVPRVGAATYRMHLLATGAAKPRDGEIADAGVLDRILVECELEDLVAARDRVRTLGAAVRGIEKVIIAEIGYEAALNLDRLPPIIDGMTAILDAAVARRDPSQAMDAAQEEGDAEPETDAALAAAPVRVGAIRSQADAAAALDAAIAYYQSYEPSSPAIPLIEQARASLGRSLYEVIAMLVPDHAATARIHVGAEPAFAVPLKAGANGGAKPEPVPTAEISTRAEASALLEQVAHFYRQSEPSSPVPLLIDRARALGSRDFLSLLKDLLPEAALKTMKVGG